MKRILLLTWMLLLFACTALSQNRDWTIVSTYDITGKSSGLAWDGSTYLYYGIYGSDGDHVYRYDPVTGNNHLQFVNPAIDDSYGMTWDGQHIWIIDQPASSGNPALATELDLSGNIISTITLPDHYMSGIAYDNGDFWVCTYYPDPGTIYKINSSGAILAQFQSPGEQPWDICLENGDLWVADYYDDMLYKIDISGSLIEGHPSENIKPSGIVYDGNYLWYCDGQISTNPSTLYKVDLGGAGTPAINIPVTLHDYGNVTVGSVAVWNMYVSNSGTAPLVISAIEIQSGVPVSSNLYQPETIDPGASTSIALNYLPTAPVPLNTVVHVLSNDPVNPSVPVQLLGHGLNEGPSALSDLTSHDYGLVRQDAHTRWFWKVKNVGSETLVIQEPLSSGAEFYTIQNEVFPKHINTLDSAMIGIWFNPDLPVPYGGTLDFQTNDPEHATISLSLEGEGVKKDWLIGEELWHYDIDAGYDNSPKAINYIHDITFDGVEDVIVCSEDNYVRCFNGNAHGTGDVMWEIKIPSGSVYSGHGLAIMDADNQGEKDVVIGSTGGDRSIIAIEGRNGNALWWHHTNEYGDGGWVYQVDCSYDYNGDGIADVLAATGDDGGDTGPKRIYCLDALDGESIWECYTDGPNFSCIGVKDFNGDGQADVVAGASSNAEDEGRVFGIDGASGNIEWTYIVGGTSVWAIIQINDISGDGIADVAVGDGVIGAGHVYYLNAANGNMIQSTYLGHTINHFAKLDDINEDGHPDILVAYGGTNGVVLSGLDATTLWFRSLADKAWVADAIGDITGDGMKDAIIGTLFTTNYCYFMNGTDGEELKSIPYYTPVDAIRAVPDIVGDNSMEMMAGGRDGKLMCLSGGINAPVGTIETAGSDHGMLASCYPNPIRASVGLSSRIDLSLAEDAAINMVAYDIRGQAVRHIFSGHKAKGVHQFEWDLKNDAGAMLPGGLYHVRISGSEAGTTLKIIVL